MYYVCIIYVLLFIFEKKKPTIKHIRKTKTKHNKTNKQTNMAQMKKENSTNQLHMQL